MPCRWHSIAGWKQGATPKDVSSNWADVSAKVDMKMNASDSDQFLGKASEQFTIHRGRQDLTQVDNSVFLARVISTGKSSEAYVKQRNLTQTETNLELPKYQRAIKDQSLWVIGTCCDFVYR